MNNFMIPAGLFGGTAKRPTSQPAMKKPNEGPSKLAMLSDLFLRAGGLGGNPMVQHQQRQQLMDHQTRQAKQQREWGLQDWMAQQDYQRNNPQPIVRDNNMGDVVSINPQTREATTLYRDPYSPTVVGPDGIRRPLDFMPRPAEGAPETLDAATVARLRGQGGGQPAQQSGNTISVEEAGRVRASMPQGQAGDQMFADWLGRNQIQIGAF